jgi:hypothetical protein
MNRDSSVCIAIDYGLDDWCSIPGTGKKLFPSPQCPDRLWGLPSLLCNGYRGGALPAQLKRPGHVADHSPQSCAEIKNGGTISALLSRSALTKHRDNFTFYLYL